MDDDYAYLEQQVDGGGATAAPAFVPPSDNGEGAVKKERSHREKDSKHRSRDKDRHRSSSRHERHERSSRSSKQEERDRERERDKERERERERERELRRRERDRAPVEFRRARESTPPAVRAAKQAEQELKDLERTVRTIMVMNLNLRAEEQDVFEFFFARVGAVNDIKIIKDKNTKRSKGIAYVEFASVESAIAALSLNGQPLLNMPVLVKPSEAEKNMQWETQQQAKQNQTAAAGLLNQIGAPAHEPIKLQILNLLLEVSEDDLRELFSPFGEINYLHVVRDPMGTSTGEAYVQYTDRKMAERAALHFNNFEIAGKRMVVQISPVYSMGPSAPAPSTVLPPPPGYDPAALAMGMMAGPPQQQQPGEQVQGEVDDLDEAETRSFRLNAQSRVALMSRLANSAGLQAPPSFYGPGGAAAAPPPAAAAPVAPAGPVLHVSAQVLDDQGLFGPASPIPTPCLLLKNMFTIADKAEPNWQADVVEDVTGEAAKFGQVLHCFPDPNSMNGNVYLKFSTPQAAEAASRALHGRYYSGRQIVVSFQFVQPYNTFFGIH